MTVLIISAVSDMIKRLITWLMNSKTNFTASKFQAFVKQGQHFSGRLKTSFLEEATHGKGIIFVSYTDEWKIQRKFGNVTLRG